MTVQVAYQQGIRILECAVGILVDHFRNILAGDEAFPKRLITCKDVDDWESQASSSKPDQLEEAKSSIFPCFLLISVSYTHLTLPTILLV